MKELANSLYNNYDSFKEPSLGFRRFKYADIQPLLNNQDFDTSIVGKSYEGRDIRQVIIGSGKRKVLLWSQMHGNEATATKAIFDIINFFSSDNNLFSDFRNTIFQNLELCFIPMLNPDGAERFIRRTAQGIDMNRDAVALQCPESRLLKQKVLDEKPEFSFNLHDQSVRYSTGYSENQTALAFLATAYNEATEWNENRIKSRQVISIMNEVLLPYIPNKIARFSDEFEPRAFGDNIQKWGSSLILLESGGYGVDTDKEYIRKLNFVAILTALYSIASNNYENYSLEDYLAIPQNQKQLFDLKVSNLKVQNPDGSYYELELGINLEEINTEKSTNFEIKSVIEDIGDLSGFWGIKNMDAKGGILRSLAEFPEIVNKYKLEEYFSKKINIDQTASFVIDHGSELTIIINGQIQP